MSSPQIGQPAPELTLPATGDRTIRLSDLRGVEVLPYFHARDDTPGCVADGQDLRGHARALEDAGATVLGVSRDSVKSHDGFGARHDPGFDPLSDREERACEAYDVIRQKKMYGRRMRSIERSAFLFATGRVLQRQWRRFKVPGHVRAVRDAVRDL